MLYAQYLTLILYLIIQLCGIRKKFNFQFIKIKSTYELKAIICMTIPALVGNSMVQINYWIDNAIASSLPEGVVSALSYGHVLDDLFVGVFITTVASIILPHFSNLIANNDSEGIKNILDNGLNIMIIILIPISMITFICSTKMVEFSFLRGKFAQESVALTSLALKGYVLRYPFVAIRDISIQSLYAYKNSKVPMRNAIICTIINIIVSVICSRYWGIIAISFGTTISAVVGAILNAFSLKKIFIQFDFSNIFDVCKKSAVPVIVVGILFYLMEFDVNTGIKIVDIIIISIIVWSIYMGGLFICRQKTVLSIGKKMFVLLSDILSKN